MSFEFDEEEFERDVKIKVVGVGAAGRGTIVNRALLLILTNAGQPLYTMIYVPKRRPRLFFGLIVNL